MQDHLIRSRRAAELGFHWTPGVRSSLDVGHRVLSESAPRERIDTLLNGAVTHRLTIVSAPAGYGKTVAVAHWAMNHPEHRVAWAPIEAGAKDSSNRGLTVEATTSSIMALCSDHLVDNESPKLLAEGGSTGYDAASDTSAIVVLESSPLTGRRVDWSGLDQLLRELPPEVHFIVIARERPDIPLSELRLADDVVEIDHHDLAFTFEEAQLLMRRTAGQKIDGEQVGQLLERTHGWAAGLQLAAAALQRAEDSTAFVRQFDGSDSFVSEYFEEKVVPTVSEELVEFVTTCSILDFLTPSLCQAVTGHANAPQLLEEVCSRHFFADQVEGGSFRLHPLFRRYLEDSFDAADPERKRAAHVRAAQCLKSEGDVESALVHLAKAEQFQRVLEISAQMLVELLENGPGADPRPGAFVLLPDSYLKQDPLGMYERAVGLLMSSRHQDAKVWIGRLEREARKEKTGQWWSPRIDFLRTIHDRLTGNPQGVLRHAARARQLMVHRVALEPPATETTSDGDSPIQQLDEMLSQLMPNLAAKAHIQLHQFGAVRQDLAGERGGPLWMTSVLAPGALSLAALGEGLLQEARRLASESLDTAVSLGMELSPFTVDTHLTLALVDYETNELDRCEDRLGLALEVCRAEMPPWCSDEVELGFVRVALARGSFDDAGSIISRLRDREAKGALPGYMRTHLVHDEIRWRLAIRDLEGVTDCLNELEDSEISPALEAKVELCAGRPEQALHHLSADPEKPLSVREGVQRLVLSARALLLLGSQRRARDQLRRALTIARPEHHVRIFLDEGGTDLEWLLSSVRTHYPEPYLDELLLHASSDGVPPLKDPPAEMITGLTNRERAVLARLPSYLSQEQIARELYVSLNTLKTHLKGLYRKLGASSRSEAIEIARKHSLI